MTRLRSIDFNMMFALCVGLGMENLNYKLIMWVKELNKKVVQSLCGVVRLSCGMGKMCKIEGKMTQALYLNILWDGVMKTIEWHHFNPSHVIFQHDNDPKHTTKLVKQRLPMQRKNCTYLASSITWPKVNEACMGIFETEIKWVSNTNQRDDTFVGRSMCKFLSTPSLLSCVKKFYQSMPNRTWVVVASQGGWPNYRYIGECRLQNQVNIYSSFQNTVFPYLVLQ